MAAEDDDGGALPNVDDAGGREKNGADSRAGATTCIIDIRQCTPVVIFRRHVPTHCPGKTLTARFAQTDLGPSLT
jgi:hypothetical protein